MPKLPYKISKIELLPTAPSGSTAQETKEDLATWEAEIGRTVV
jgi:hypothetical protein